MTSARAIEHRIIRKLSTGAPGASARQPGAAERIIAVTAAAAGLLLLGSLAPGLVFTGVIASTLVVLTI